MKRMCVRSAQCNRSMAILLAVTVSGAVASPCMAGTKITVGKRLPASQRIAIDQIRHDAWNVLLGKYVDRAGNVDYALWKRTAADVRALDGYLAHLSRTDISGSKNTAARMAFWINAYNAVTVKGILREYPTKSIRDHTARLYGYNIWHDLVLPIGGRDYSLHQIEHDLLRKSGDARIHFAIVCASQSCPRLLNRVYTAEHLEQQLEAAAREFFANAKNYRFDAKNNTVWLSAVMKWFAKDFGASQAAQLRAVAGYLSKAESLRLARTKSVRVKYLSYDWGLNDQRTASRR